MSEKKISQATIKRLSVYLRFLETLKRSGIQKASSVDFEKKLGINSAQVRKDFSFFGDFGQKGVGYDVDSLFKEIQTILNLDQKIPVCLIGAGKLGTALCYFNMMQKDPMEIVSVFDNSPLKVGNKIEHLLIQPVEEMISVIQEKKIQVAIITVPGGYAQYTADRLISAGVKAILNFAPIPLKMPEGVQVQDVDFTADLHSLAYFLSK